MDDSPATSMLSARPRRSGATSVRSGASARSQFHSRRWLLMPWIARMGSVEPGRASTASPPPSTGLRCRHGEQQLGAAPGSAGVGSSAPLGGTGSGPVTVAGGAAAATGGGTSKAGPEAGGAAAAPGAPAAGRLPPTGQGYDRKYVYIGVITQ